jgi:flagellar protein FlgJ
VSIDPSPPATPAPLTAEQQAALKNLHVAAQKFEAVFVDMLFKQMRAASPTTSITGKVSNAESTFEDMLDEKRSESIATTGSFGIGAMLEESLKASVLANPARAAKARLPREGDF